jgi:hypothetical protein
MITLTYEYAARRPLIDENRARAYADIIQLRTENAALNAPVGIYRWHIAACNCGDGDGEVAIGDDA